MTQRQPGGRTQVGGIGLSQAERAVIDEAAARQGKSRAEFIRDAALMVAGELLGVDASSVVPPGPRHEQEVKSIALRIAALRRQHGR